jgi:hypothetical protein
MKNILCILLGTSVLVGCSKPSPQKSSDEPVGASFREGHGVEIPEPMRKSLGIQIVDVGEQKIIPRLEIPLHVIRGADEIRPVSTRQGSVEASGWITSKQAEGITPGQKGQLLLPDGESVSAEVRRLEKAADFTLGDFEIVVSTDAPLATGTAVTARIEKSSTGEVVAVPKSAVMKTAEGEFVYAVNEEYFKRTQVQTGARNDESIEVTDGLYAGDQIVSAQVIPLWMTELQTLRAGQSCCKGK